MYRLKIFTLSLVALFIFSLPLAGQAIQDKSQENIYIGPTEVFNENAFKVGNSVIIEGQINGDLFVVGNVITIKGPVAGNIFVTGNMVTINSDVAGSVFVAGSSVSIAGRIGGSVQAIGSNVVVTAETRQNVLAFGASVTLDQNASVGWDLTVGAANIGVNGPIDRNANFYGASVILGNKISGNVYAEIEEGGNMMFLPGAQIDGDLSYKAKIKDQLVIQDESIVSGEISFGVSEKEGKEEKSFWHNKFGSAVLMWKLVSMASLIIMGLVMVLLIRKPMEKIVEEKNRNLWLNIGWGIIIFIIVPIVAVLLMITIIGLPLGLIVLAMYFVAVYLVKIFASLVIGSWILEVFNKKQKPDVLWSLIIGVIAFMILISIPLIGWIFKLLAVWWGLGKLIVLKKDALEIINK